MPGKLGHLSSRFFDVLFARPLDSAERATIAIWLSPELAEVFFDQPAVDQRHGYEAGLFAVDGGAHPDVVVAAVMHDIGKRHSGLGVLGRVLASLAIKSRLPLGSRVRLYRDHGIVAAKELAELGAPAIAVDYALHHHGPRPQSIPAEIWNLLENADRPKPAKLAGSGISSCAT